MVFPFGKTKLGITKSREASIAAYVFLFGIMVQWAVG